MKIEDELKKMRGKLNMAIGDLEKWLALDLSGINELYEGESPQKKCKMGPKPSESNSSEIAKDYLNLFRDEARFISNIEKYFRNQEPKNETINPLAKRKVK
ncbi:hypothetical protein O181_018775 [Austropuccinia psidii MF-1]|uniref:Uncharacterized protein n=1 Tax=Austropuccinia psidii MF-1 TaxID=1389203 RepID=A0A9Q3C9B8_9BASI|nr:hypothetical protein [Austropuccinia psidii MF-1]